MVPRYGTGPYSGSSSEAYVDNSKPCRTSAAWRQRTADQVQLAAATAGAGVGAGAAGAGETLPPFVSRESVR
jgi:hypothetical protein